MAKARASMMFSAGPPCGGLACEQPWDSKGYADLLCESIPEYGELSTLHDYSSGRKVIATSRGASFGCRRCISAAFPALADARSAAPLAPRTGLGTFDARAPSFPQRTQILTLSTEIV